MIDQGLVIFNGFGTRTIGLNPTGIVKRDPINNLFFNVFVKGDNGVFDFPFTNGANVLIVINHKTSLPQE